MPHTLRAKETALPIVIMILCKKRTRAQKILIRNGGNFVNCFLDQKTNHFYFVEKNLAKKIVSFFFL